MKTNYPAPIGADPVGSFLATLPKEAKILGAKCYRSPDKSTIYLCYYFDSRKIQTSFTWEGGKS
jgi:hypothetical protein